MSPLRTVLAALVALAPSLASAQSAGEDGYCDYVEGTASATAAPLYAPQLFAQFGYIEQPSFAVTPSPETGNLRLIGGVRYSLTNILAGSATTARARAECRRHGAVVQLRRATANRAWTARVRVYDEAQPEAERILAEITADLEARRATVQEATAMRLRVEELRALAGNARRELAAQPAPLAQPLGTLLTEFRSADADVESSEGKLRALQPYDVSVRVGVDRFLEGPNASTQFLAVVQVGFNLGALWIGRANERAAAGRRRYARTGADPLVASATVEQLRATIDVESKRAAEAAALVADLGKQMEMLANIGSADSRRLRETLWFDWIKAKAEVAYLQAHVTALREILGAHAP